MLNTLMDIFPENRGGKHASPLTLSDDYMLLQMTNSAPICNKLRRWLPSASWNASRRCVGGILEMQPLKLDLRL